MKLFVSLCVAWLAVAAAGCCHSDKNDCCQGAYYGAPASGCCNNGTTGYYNNGTVPHGTLHPTPAPAPADGSAYDVAPMPPK